MAKPTVETKRERRDSARQERRARIERARQHQQLSRRLVVGIIIAGVVVALAALIWFVVGSRDSVGRAAPIEGATHVEEGTPIAYQNVPPSSGPHYPITAPYGVSDRPIDPGYWVHNLEHGAVAVLYNCPSGCPDLVNDLRQAFVNLPRSRTFNRVKLVATPHANMPSQIAFVAWGRVEEYDRFDYDKLLRFYNTYVDKGPEAAL